MNHRRISVPIDIFQGIIESLNPDERFVKGNSLVLFTREEPYGFKRLEFFIDDAHIVKLNSYEN